MRFLTNIFGKKKELQDTENICNKDDEVTIEECNNRLNEIKKTLVEVRENNKKIAEDVRINKIAKTAIPMANYRLDELRKYNTQMESATTPEILSNSKGIIDLHVLWFVEQEELYPNAPWLMVGGANNMLDRVRCRYNELLYGLAESEFNRYKIVIQQFVTNNARTKETEVIFSEIENLRGFVDTTASNYVECFDSLNNLHSQIEDLFSVL